MTKIISIDSGRGYVKAMCNGVTEMFPAAIASAPDELNMNIEGKATDLWVKINNKSFFVGDLAIRQRPGSTTQERNSDKTNDQNVLQVLTAVSLFATFPDDVILLINVPARDYSNQRDKLQQKFNGKSFSVHHKAGKMAGKTSHFTIIECHVLPEGETSYYGVVFNNNLEIVRKDIFAAMTLVLDIGDQTTNYITCGPGGEPVDDYCGSLNLGMHVSKAGMQRWLMKQGVEMNQAELSRYIENGEHIRYGAREIDYFDELQRQYSQLETSIYNQLSVLIPMDRYQFIILAGGGGIALHTFIKNRYKHINVVSSDNSPFLGCCGQEIIYRLSK